MTGTEDALRRGRHASMKVTHLITDLDVGGAEMLLYRSLAHVDRDAFELEVVSLAADGVVTGLVRDLGIPVTSLGYRGRLAAPAGMAAVARYLRRSKPDLVQTWMYHADLIGGIGARVAGVRNIVWGLHAAPDPRRERLDPGMRVGLRAAAALSRRLPTKIVCCSYETERVHVALGYAPDKLIVIPNGFEPLERVDDAAQDVRVELGLPEDALLVLRVGRDHPQKDNASLLAAFRRVVDALPAARLCLVGEGMDRSNRELSDEIARLRLIDEVILLGPRDDVTRLNSAADIAVSSSYSEGLPVVLGEAMSVGTPVVATDAGDSRVLIDDPDRIVPVRDPGALGAAIVRVLSMVPAQRAAVGERDRDRIRSSFGFERMLASYESLYAQIERGVA